MAAREGACALQILTAWYVQPEFVPKIKDQNRSEDRYDQTAGVKPPAGAWRIKEMRYRPTNDRPDNAKHDCPRDR